MATLKDYADKNKLALTWDKTTGVSLNGTNLSKDQLTGAGLSLIDGRWTGEDSAIQKLSNPVQTVKAPVQTLGTPVSSVPTLTPSNVVELEAQKRTAELKRAYEQSIGKLATEETKAIQGFEGERSNTRLQGQMQAKAFEDYLAEKGISSSGTAPQGFLQQTGQTQGQLGASTLQQQQFQTDTGLARAQLGSDLEFGTAQANIDAQIRQAQELQRQQELADQRAYQESIYNRDIAREDTQMANEQSRADFGSQIMANYRDISAFANKLQTSGAPQWQIDQARAAVQQKIQEQGLDQIGRPIAQVPEISSSVAYDLWKQQGTANESVSRALGIPVGTRFVETQASRSSGSSGGSSGGNDITTLAPKQIIAIATEELRGTSGITSAEKMVQLNDQGYFDKLAPSELKSLMNKFDITELMLEQAENRSNANLTQAPYRPVEPIKLPTGKLLSGGLAGPLNTAR